MDQLAGISPNALQKLLKQLQQVLCRIRVSTTALYKKGLFPAVVAEGAEAEGAEAEGAEAEEEAAEGAAAEGAEAEGAAAEEEAAEGAAAEGAAAAAAAAEKEALAAAAVAALSAVEAASSFVQWLHQFALDCLYPGIYAPSV